MFLTRAAVVRILPFAIFILFLSLNEQLAVLLSPVMPDPRWLYVIRVSIISLLLALFWREYTELNKSAKLKTSFYYISILAGLVVFVLWIAPYPAWAMAADATGFNPMRADGEGMDLALMLARLSGAALVVPLMEELFWRSYLMRWLHNQNFLEVNPATVGIFSFVATASLFAVEHSLWLAGLLAGLIYGALYKYTRNLWAPVIAHAVTNGLLGVWVIYTQNWQYW